MSISSYNRCCVCGQRYRISNYPPRHALAYECDDADDMCPACVDLMLDEIDRKNELEFLNDERFAIQHEMEGDE